jgi:hypothetical protein
MGCKPLKWRLRERARMNEANTGTAFGGGVGLGVEDAHRFACGIAFGFYWGWSGRGFFWTSLRAAWRSSSASVLWARERLMRCS